MLGRLTIASQETPGGARSLSPRLQLPFCLCPFLHCASLTSCRRQDALRPAECPRCLRSLLIHYSARFPHTNGVPKPYARARKASSASHRSASPAPLPSYPSPSSRLPCQSGALERAAHCGAFFSRPDLLLSARCHVFTARVCWVRARHLQDTFA